MTKGTLENSSTDQLASIIKEIKRQIFYNVETWKRTQFNYFLKQLDIDYTQDPIEIFNQHERFYLDKMRNDNKPIFYKYYKTTDWKKFDYAILQYFEACDKDEKKTRVDISNSILFEVMIDELNKWYNERKLEEERLRAAGFYNSIQDLLNDAVTFIYESKNMGEHEARYKVLLWYFEKWLIANNKKISDKSNWTKETFTNFHAEYIQNIETAKQKIEEEKNSWKGKSLAKSINEIECSQEHLRDLFEKISDYKFIIDALADEKLIDRHTLIWKDHKKGNKSVLVCVLKTLKIKGYFKKNIIITNEKLQAISYNTFNVRLSIDLIKKIDADSLDIEFIPVSSTLP